MSFYREIYIKTLKPHIIPEDEYTVKILFFLSFLDLELLENKKNPGLWDGKIYGLGHLMIFLN